MIQFNLLPDIKQEFVKVNRTKHAVVIISILVSVVLVIIFLLLLSWDGLQKKNLNDINSDINTSKTKLLGTNDLNQILTIQNQLNALPALESQDPMVSNIFGYLSEITPDAATISTLSTDYGQHTMQISGDADSLATINVFADTLKFTTYSVVGSKQTKPAFSDVVLSAFGVQGGDTTYTLSLDFDPALFSSASKVALTVPSKTTTRSETEQPTDLFKQTTKATTTGN